MRDGRSAPRSSSSSEGAQDVFAGGGAMGDVMRTIDWAATPLGPVAGWSAALRATVGLVLHNHFPMLLWWGPELVQLYNDAYRPVLGDKHPRAMGQPCATCWPEIWDVIGPMAEAPLRGVGATTNDDLFLLLNRSGFAEETHFKVAYSPVPDASVPGTGIGGVLATVAETTQQVYGERQLRTLRNLGARAGEAKTPFEACSSAADSFEQNDWDIPFALIYLLEEDGARARLACSAGFGDALESGYAPEVDLHADAESAVWPIAAVVREGRPVVLERLGERLGERVGSLPRGRWSVSPDSAIALPLASPEQARPYGVLICGVSPHRTLDTGYRTFFELAAAQVVTAIRNARAYEAERKRAEVLAELDRAKTTFFSNVSHEFRTPLTLMLGPQEDALASPSGALRGEPLRVVHRNTQRLLKLVNTLLNFSRVEAGRAKARYEPTDLPALTRDLASAFRSAIERGRLRFDVLCQALPEPVYVDRDMWEKIVLNLLSNAFKFTLAGAISVVLRPAGDRVELEVADSGVGIPAGELSRVFERFHRIEGTRARTFEGSGIGLALVHELVGLHGGRIDVASEVGMGTRFVVSIPFGNAHLPPEHVTAPGPLPDAAAGAEPFVQEALRWVPDGENRLDQAEGQADDQDDDEDDVAGEVVLETVPIPARVLVVDDNADMREYVTRLLRPRWTVEAVADGAQALARARAVRPDLVLTDVMMPDLDGFGLLRELRADARTAGVPVIMLSARAGEEARLEGLAAGADDYLVKPFSAKELVSRVHVHLENARVRRAAEAERNRLRALLGQLPAIVNFLRGPELVFEFVHPRAAPLLDGRELLGRPLLEAIPELRGEELPLLLRQVIETGRPSEGRERLVRLPGGDGHARESYWNYVYLPVADPSGKVEGVMTFDIEVTEQVLARKKVEEQAAELQRAGKEAEAARRAAESANFAKDAFLAMLGHEMRNPLAPIRTSIQLMRLRGFESRELQIIERQVDHLVRLVDDLLDVSRVTRGKLELERAPLELAEAIFEGVEMTKPLVESRGQTVELAIPATGLSLVGDRGRLVQVVANLVNNASKFSPRGGTIAVTAARAGGRAHLVVRDRGAGIAPEMLDRIFEPFVQEQQTLERSRGGLGLGLAIVRSVIELHGGRVSALSEGLGRGTEIVVELPLAEAWSSAVGRPLSDAAEATLEAPARSATLAFASRPPPASGRPGRVLLVDDNEDAREILADALRELGYDVATAPDGQVALEIAREIKPNVCLVDIGLPVMDGYELARHLRDSNDLPAGARIVAISGYGQDADRQRSSAAGFNAHLVKPVTIDDVTRTLVN